MVDIELDPFDNCRLLLATSDSRILAFKIPQELTTDLSEPFITLNDVGMDRIGALHHNPVAKSLLLSLSTDSGVSTARLWDVEVGQMLIKVKLPGGAVSFN